MLLSLPHCGTGFPDGLVEEFVPLMIEAPDDTDWNLDILYDFATSLGVTIIFPKYSRWVIDLNREPENRPLYDDGRIITALCPVTDFQGNSIYKDNRPSVPDPEIKRRTKRYFAPYHDRIDEELESLRSEFGFAVFWDGHSIRRHVPTIQPDPFPDFILGSNDGQSADNWVIETALRALGTGNYDISHNRPFKGGYLTRSKGDPANNIHALQLEMSKDLYMKANETVYSKSKASPVKMHLKNVFAALIRSMEEYEV